MNTNSIIYSFATTPLWMNPSTGKVETVGASSIPSPIVHTADGRYVYKELNEPAKRLMAALEKFSRESEIKRLARLIADRERQDVFKDQRFGHV